MFKHHRLLIAVVVGLLVLPAVTAVAQDSVLVSYQGRLTDDAGDPVPNSTYQVTFSLWSSADNGEQKWSEIHPAVATDNGLFTVILGSVSRLNETVFETEPLYLQIEIGEGEIITPRTLLTSAPSAAFAKKVIGDIETDEGMMVMRDENGDSVIVLSCGVGRGMGKIYMMDPVDKKELLTLSSSHSTGANIKLMEPIDKQSVIEMSTGNDIGGQITIFDTEPIDKSEIIAISGAPSGLGTFKMFNPQPEPPAKYLEMSVDPASGPSLGFFDDIGQVMGFDPGPFNEAFGMYLMDPGDDGKLFELTGNHITNEVSMKLIDPVDEKNLLTINGAQSGASFKMFNPQPEPPISLLELRVEEVSGPASDWASYFNMYSMDPGDDGRETFEISNTITDGISLKMFNPQPEPPAKYLEMGVDPASGPSLGFFDDIGQVMGLEPCPWNEAFGMYLMDPGDDGKLFELTGNYNEDEVNMYLMDPGDDGKLVEISGSYGGRGGSGEVAVYDTDNALESHLTPAKLVLQHTSGMISYPPIYLDATSVDDPRIGIGTDTPSEPLVVGNDLTYFAGGNMITVGDGSATGFAGISFGQDADNRGWVLYDNENDYISFGTKEDGVFAPNKICIKDGDLGIGIESPSEDLHVVGDICYTGSIGTCSDVRYKRKISTLKNALDKVSRMRGVSFEWKTDEYPDYKFADEEQVGVIAQEVKEILPQVVTEDNKGYYNVDYTKLTPLLIEAIKELKADNEELRNRIEQLEEQVRL